MNDWSVDRRRRRRHILDAISDGVKGFEHRKFSRDYPTPRESDLYEMILNSIDDAGFRVTRKPEPK